jgi:hypothetical protein
MRCSARLVANRTGLKTRAAVLGRIIARIEAAVAETGHGA